MHQIKRVGKEADTTEVARFQGKAHLAFFSTDRVQYRYASRNFCAD
jgi:hypothetical protein